MKKLLLFSTALLTIAQLAAQTTATNFTCNDCAGTSHNLFTELNSGKVIVLTWVMPCGACIAGASTAATTAQGFSTSNPGVVKFYLVDDNADTPCNTLGSWANTNSITTTANFSNAAIDMANYGTSGMPKTIVVGGPNHTIFYNQNGTPSSSALHTAISNAITASTTGIIETNNVSFGLTVFPNPAVNSAKVNYTLTASTEVSINVINVLGQIVNTVSLGKQSAGKQEYQVNLESLYSGIYFIKINTGEATETVKLTINR